MTEAKLYRVAEGGNEIGEMTVEEMVEATLAHRLSPDAYYLHEASLRWKPIAQIVQPRIDAMPQPAAARFQGTTIPKQNQHIVGKPPPPNPREELANIHPNNYIGLCRAIGILLAILGTVGGLMFVQNNMLLGAYIFTALFLSALFFCALGEIIALLARIEHNTRK